MSDPAPHIFVSYASADHARVAPLASVLERAGVSVWLDRTGIPGGVNYGPEIVAAIKASAAVVLCCSAAAFASRNVRQEVALAWAHERPILPLLLERVAVPDDLAYWLEAAQWIEVLDRPADDWLPRMCAGRSAGSVSPVRSHRPCRPSRRTARVRSGCRPRSPPSSAAMPRRVRLSSAWSPTAW